MIRRAALALVLGSLVLSGGMALARDTVRVLALSDALDPALLDAFGQANGADVLVDGLATANDVVAALRGKRVGYDLVMLQADDLGTRIAPEVLTPLDRTAIPDAAVPLPELGAALGQNARVAVAFDWYPTGLLVNPAKFAATSIPGDPDAGWDLFNKPELLREAEACSLGVPESGRDVFSFLAAATGGRSNDALERRRILSLLGQLRAPAQRGSLAERANGVSTGDLCAAVLPEPDAALAEARAHEAGTVGDLRFLLPSGGSPLTVDVLAVPAQAANPRGGVALLRFLLQPDHIAANARYGHVAPADSGDAGDEPALGKAWLSRLHLAAPADATLDRTVDALWRRTTTP